ncbi:MAG: hypothetical protein M3Q07_13350 [Pseudobdellovibrionaceae bacterium]|nr:hypothetical protein [Pseudobdellovibrionaceae bacterium]
MQPGYHMCRWLGPWVVLFLASACVHPNATKATAGFPDGKAAWELLQKTLPGTWTTPNQNGSFKVSYRLISGDSALVETWGAGSPHETETVFHPDHDQLALTHYCAQGNQARLRMESFEGHAITFRRFDVSNRLPGQGVLSKLILRFTNNSFERIETYEGSDGKAETDVLHFKRN